LVRTSYEYPSEKWRVIIYCHIRGCNKVKRPLY